MHPFFGFLFEISKFNYYVNRLTYIFHQLNSTTWILGHPNHRKQEGH